MRKLIILAACLAVAACGKPTAKFQPGDKVMVKLTQEKGVVVTRLSPFLEDHYYLRVPSEEMPEFDPDPSITDEMRAKFVATWPKWRGDGPYYDTELVPTE